MSICDFSPSEMAEIDILALRVSKECILKNMNLITFLPSILNFRFKSNLSQFFLKKNKINKECLPHSRKGTDRQDENLGLTKKKKLFHLPFLVGADLEI